MDKGILQVAFAGSSAIALSLTDIEIIVKIAVGLATLAYILYKTYREWKKN